MLVQMAFQTHVIVATIYLIVCSSFIVLFEVRFTGGKIHNRKSFNATPFTKDKKPPNVIDFTVFELFMGQSLFCNADNGIVWPYINRDFISFSYSSEASWF